MTKNGSGKHPNRPHHLWTPRAHTRCVISKTGKTRYAPARWRTCEHCGLKAKRIKIMVEMSVGLNVHVHIHPPVALKPQLVWLTRNREQQEWVTWEMPHCIKKARRPSP